jgi:hypothetical protein
VHAADCSEIVVGGLRDATDFLSRSPARALQTVRRRRERDTRATLFRNALKSFALIGDERIRNPLAPPPEACEKKADIGCEIQADAPLDIPDMRPEENPREAPQIPPRSDRKTRLKTRLIAVRNLDQRTRAATRARKLAAEFEAELGGNVTTAMHIAIERAAALTVVAEDARARRLAGDLSITLDDLVRTDRAAAAAVKALGLDKRREPTGPTLHEYFAARAAETGQDAGEGSADSGAAA